MNILEVKTEHTGPFKTMIEVLKELIPETNIEFRMSKPNMGKKNKDNDELSDSDEEISDEEEFEEEVSDEEVSDEEVSDEESNATKNETKDKSGKIRSNKNKKANKYLDGMRITAVDTTKTVLINLNLYAKNFGVFKCRKKKLVLGVNLGYLHKLIKSMDKDDNISLYVENDSRDYLKIKIDNPENYTETAFELKLLDLTESKFVIPDTEFDAVVTLNSNKFHKICREMSHIAELVEIKCLSDKIIFTCKGDYANRKTTMHANNDGDTVDIKYSSKNSRNKIIQGIYELRNLVLFAKCSSLCNDIQIFMKNDYPIVIRYTVATLGNIILCLSPTSDDTIRDGNYSDDDAYYSEEEVKYIT